MIVNDTIEVPTQDSQITTYLIELQNNPGYTTGTISIWGIYVPNSEVHSKDLSLI